MIQHRPDVVSVKIEMGADEVIECADRDAPVAPARPAAHGHHKRDAVRMKALIQRHQNDTIATERQRGKHPKAKRTKL